MAITYIVGKEDLSGKAHNMQSFLAFRLEQRTTDIKYNMYLIRDYIKLGVEYFSIFLELRFSSITRSGASSICSIIKFNGANKG